MDLQDRQTVASCDAQEFAVGTIVQEHRTLGLVVSAVRQWMAKVAAGHAEADFGFLAAALYYINDFPERYHHPKEEDHLFSALRRRTDRFNPLLEELGAEHARGAKLIAGMEHALVLYQGGAPDGLAFFRDAVEAYATMLGDHMRKEEQLLAEAAGYLESGDWRKIADAFEANDDPLLGSRAAGELAKLYGRIMGALPTKLQPAYRRASGAAAGQ